MSNKHKFFFHYDKVLSQATGVNHMQVHCRKRVYKVHTLKCSAEVCTRVRKRWPQMVMCGVGRVKIRGGVATILPLEREVVE